MVTEQTKISILIPTLVSRISTLDALTKELVSQRKKFPLLTDGAETIQILKYPDNGENSIGAKRNRLVSEARGEYVCFIDDDDMVSSDYIETLLEGIKTGCDCISLRGEITIDGGKPEIFEHSLKYDKWETREGEAIKYIRTPNHLNCIKRSIAMQIKFPEINHGEDHSFSKALHASGLIKSEYYTDKILYYYKYKSVK